MQSNGMTVHVNGQPRAIETGATVAELLRELQITVPHVAVELNLEVLPRSRHAETVLQEGDRVEVVTLVGGG